MSGVEVAAIAATLAAVSTVAEGYSQYQQGKEQKKANDTNAEILRRNAAQKRLETSINEDAARAQSRQRISAARAAAAEAGMSDSATMLQSLGQMSADEEQNALNLRWQGESEAANYLSQADMQNYYGRVAKANGKNAFKMSLLNAGINGVSTFSSMNKSGNTKKE